MTWTDRPWRHTTAIAAESLSDSASLAASDVGCRQPHRVGWRMRQTGRSINTSGVVTPQTHTMNDVVSIMTGATTLQGTPGTTTA